MILAILLLLLLVATGVTVLFKAFVASRISHDVLRIITIGIFFIGSTFGSAWAGITLLFNAIDPMSSYPISTHKIDDDYSFTQQVYGFVTMMSQGYNLTFYQQRPFWFNKELGQVQLECAGKEVIAAVIAPLPDKRIRLKVSADKQIRLDTILTLHTPFNFRRTFEDRTVDFSR